MQNFSYFHGKMFWRVLSVLCVLISTSMSMSSASAADITAPTVPANLQASAVAATQIHLSWSASTDNVGVTGYRVYRCQGSSCTNFARIATPTATSFNDTGLAANTTYRYRVRAIDAAGNRSNYSAITNATTLNTPPPPQTSGSACSAPPLPFTGTRMVNVSTEAQLQNAVANAQTGDTIVLANGTYNLTSTLYLNGKHNVTMRGNSGCDSVILVGKGMDNANYGSVLFGIWSNALNTTIAHLTIRDTYDNAIVFNAGAQSPHVYSVKLLNAGSQFIKANPTDPANGIGVDNGMIEYSWLEYTAGPPATNHGAGIGYTNGLSVHTADNWVIRNNVFKNFHTPDAAAYLWNPAVLVWNHSQNTLTEKNIFINVDRAIAYGLIHQTTGTDHAGGTIRNNVVYLQPGLMSASRKAGSDGAIIVWDSPNTQVYHNTILTNGNVVKAIEFRFVTTGGEARNNLADAPIGSRDGATFAQSGNYLAATPAMFVNPASADLHLLDTTATRANVIDRGVVLPAVTHDIDGHSRPAGAGYDIGADEFLSSSQPPAGSLGADTTPPSVPQSLSTTVVSATQINLSWSASTDNVGVTGYRVYRSGTQIGTTTSPSYAVTGLAPATTYAFTVAAVDAAGNVSAPSASASAKTAAPPDTTAPTVPTNLQASTVSATQIHLSWSASTDNVGVTGYRVYRSGTQIGTPPSPNYAVTRLAPATTYAFTVAAVDAAGNVSTSSNITAANTLPLPAPAPGTPPPPAPGSLPLVQQTDLVYLGAFRLPVGTFGGSSFDYGGTAPAYNPTNNALFLVGHDWQQQVAEVTIPQIINSSQLSKLATASVLQPFTDASEGKMFTVDVNTIKVGGLMVYGGKLYGTAYSYYDGDGNQVLSHYRSALNLSGKGDVQGMYQVGSLGAGFVSGYMTAIPSAWQSVLGGPALTGQCCLAIISRTSYGPAVSVFDPNDLGVKNPVPDIPLLYYPANHPLADWSATSPYFNGSTGIKGLVFPQNTRSLLFFGHHGIGTFCYGPGTSDLTLAGKLAPGSIDPYCYDPEDRSKGTHAYPYVSQVWAYDAAALLQVKNGQIQPWSVKPYAVWSLHVPIAGAFRIGGATYDPQTGRIFVSQECADTNCLPVIHVFQAP